MDAARTAAGITRLLDEGRTALQRYSPATAVDRVRSNRNVIRFAASQVLHPVRLGAGFGAYRDAIARQGELFVRQRVDDITDAMRHAGASALVVDRVARRAGTGPDVAAEFMRRLGRAHELDSNLTGAYREASGRMDLHNNGLGIGLAVSRLAAAPGPATRAGEQALEGAVLRALADGRGLVLESPTTPLRPSTAAELAALLRDPSRIA